MLKKSGDFDIPSFYSALRGSSPIIFPWQSIWGCEGSTSSFFLCLDGCVGGRFFKMITCKGEGIFL